MKFKNNTLEEKSALIANYLLALYAFILPISTKLAAKVFIGVVIFTLFSGNLKEKFRNALKDKIVLAFLLFYMMYVFWALGSDHLSTVLFKLKEFKYLIEIPFIIYMVLRKEFIYKILGGFIAGMLLSELMSYSLYFQIPISHFFDHIPLMTLNTIHANVPFMGSYTAYSVCLSLCMNIILYRLLTHQTKNPYIMILFSLFFISASINIFLIASRLGYIFFATSIFFTLLYAFKKQLTKVLVLFLLLLSTGYSLAFYYSPFFKDRVTAAISDVKNSLNASYASPGGIRIGYYFYGWEVIKQNPLFGVGTGDHMAEVLKVIDQKEINITNKNILHYNYTSGDHASFDSEYLDIIVQFGIIGLILFFNIIFQLVRYAQDDSQIKYIQYLLALSMIVIAGPSLIFIPTEVGKALVLLASLTVAITHIRSTSALHST